MPHTLIQKLVSRPGLTGIMKKLAEALDPPLLHLTHGRFSISGWIGGFPVFEMITIGAKSGLERTHPIIGISAGEEIVLVASNFGAARHPAWYYNLKANPVATLHLNGRSGLYSARQADPTEYEHYWKLANEAYLGFSVYREQAKREIPIMILRVKET